MSFVVRILISPETSSAERGRTIMRGFLVTFITNALRRSSYSGASGVADWMCLFSDRNFSRDSILVLNGRMMLSTGS